MNTEVVLKSQINLINSIVASTNELSSCLLNNSNLTPALHETITQILAFLNKTLALMPEILLTTSMHGTKKSDLILAFADVVEKWKNITHDPFGFVWSWSDFADKWNTFILALEDVRNSGNSIFLSLN